MNTLEYLRSFRVFEVSVFDYIGSYIVFYIIFNIFGINHSARNYMLVIPISLVVHILVGQETVFTRQLFSEEINFFKIYIIGYIITIGYLST